MFDECAFSNYCEDRYLHEYCDQEEAVRLQEADAVMTHNRTKGLGK